MSAFVLYVLLFGLAAEVVVLGLQNRRLKKDLARALDAGVITAPARPPLEIGDRLLPLPELVDAEGVVRDLSFGADQPDRLLLVFNTRCPACSQTLPAWNELAETLGEQIEVVAVTSDPPAAVEDYRQRKAFAFEAFSFRQASYRDALRVDFVPHTLLIDALGTVRGVWPGALDASRLTRIVRLLATDRGDAISQMTLSAVPASAAASTGCARDLEGCG